MLLCASLSLLITSVVLLVVLWPDWPLWFLGLRDVLSDYRQETLGTKMCGGRGITVLESTRHTEDHTVRSYPGVFGSREMGRRTQGSALKGSRV